MSQVRQQRAANGSRRKRDLEAVKPDNRVHFDRDAWLSEHLTGEILSRVRSALHAVWAQHQGQRVPTPQEVLERLEQRGETRAQLEAQYGELA